MTRSPLAYPLTRGADVDGGGAADLQTDIMRFLAILSLCLVAIFALVQSIPLTPVAPEPAPPSSQPEPQPVSAKPAPQPVMPVPDTAPGVTQVTGKARPISLTRPQWQPRKTSLPGKETPTPETEPVSAEATPAPSPEVAKPPAAEEDEGFTLQFASDAALMRAVATSHVGVYAIEGGRAYRMTVSDSRVSFWDASTPNIFHEMERHTVPAAVVDALARTGADVNGVSWGVTLPGKLKAQLDTLMQEYRGGSLIIGPDGALYREES